MAAIHFRILGYVTTIFLHVTNMAVLHINTTTFSKEDELSADDNITLMKGMLSRYFTLWTLMLQICYAALGLGCDLSTLRNATKENYAVWAPIRGVRNVLFAALVWPCTLVVFTVFWTLYNYDRSLIYPEFADKLISWTSNHILHTAIVPIVLWEVLFRARTLPRSHWSNILHLTVHLVVYLSVLYYTYYEKGVWLYPIFKVTYGSINFLYVHACMGLLFYSFYFLQWFLNNIIHGSQGQKKKV